MTNKQLKKKHKHKRLKGFQFCKCGEYVGIPREFLTWKEFKKKYL